MTTILIAIHVIIGLTLIGVILIQRGQGADMGVSFGGGGAQTLFGSRGSGSFLGKMTGLLAASFMATSLTLAFFTQQNAGSVVENGMMMPMQNQSAPAREANTTFDPSTLKSDPVEESLPPIE